MCIASSSRCAGERARRAKVVYEELLEEDGENAEMTILAKARMTTATARAGIRGLPSIYINHDN